MIELTLVFGLFFGGYYFGQRNERLHFASLRLREEQVIDLPHRSTGKKDRLPEVRESQLFYGSVVLGQDYFKAVVFAFINLFGGRVGVYESLLDRGRREALLRLKDKAKKWGAQELINVRYETANINQNTGKKNKGGVGVMEIMVYGTGIRS